MKRPNLVTDIMQPLTERGAAPDIAEQTLDG